MIGSVASNAQFQWAKMGGGMYQDDIANAVAVDSQGNVYTIGTFNNTAEFAPSIPSATLTAFGAQDIFISKFDTYGNFIWVKRIGGVNIDIATSIAVDSIGNVYASGYFNGIIDLDPGIGMINSTISSGSFLLKLDLSGNFVWVKEYNAFIKAIKISKDQSIYISGSFNGTMDFNPGPGNFSLTSGGNDVFISKLDAIGNFIWADKLGSGNTLTTSMEIDTSGNVLTVGKFTGIADFDPGIGIFNLNDTISGHVFISKIDMNGHFVWAHAIHANDVHSVCVDQTDNVLLSGYYSVTFDVDPGTGTYTLLNSGVYLLKLDSAGNFIWAKNFDGFQSAIATDQQGNIFLTAGYIGVDDFDPGPNICIMESNYWSLYLVKLNSAGNFIWAKQFVQTVPSVDSEPNDIEIDQNGSIYSCGKFKGNIDFDPTNAVDSLTSHGAYDMYLVKLKACTPGSYSFNAVACDMYMLNGQFYNTQGTYLQVLTGALGCDSLLTVYLTIHHVNTAVTQTGTTLTSSATGVTYQWIRCPVNVIIPGATNQSYTPIINGSYAVILTDVACVDTSLCLTVTGIVNSLHDQSFQHSLQLTPNPGEGKFTIQSGEELKDVSIKVIDITGQLILNQQHLNGSSFQYDISNQSNGIYFIQLNEHGRHANFKWVKE